VSTFSVRRLRPQRDADDPPLGASARLLFGGYLISAVGTGIVYPYLAIYVQQIRRLGGTDAAIVLALFALGSVAGSLVAGPPIDRLGPRVVGAAGIVFQAVGYGLLGFSAAATPIFVAAAVAGVSTGAFYTALSPAINLICPPSQHRRAFAVRYMLNNLGLAAGALIALIVLGSHTDTFRFTTLYEADAASYFVFLVFFLVSLSGYGRPEQNPSQEERSGPGFRFRNLLSNRLFVGLLVIQVLLVVGGFSQIQSVIPLLLRIRLGAPVYLISFLLTMNCVGVVLIQPLVVRFSAKVPERRLLAAVGAIWVVAFVFAAGVAFHGSLGLAAIILFGLTFTIGECFYGPSYQTLVVRFAPPDQLGRYSSVSWSAFGGANFIAPPLGVLIVNSRWPYLLWLACGSCCAVAALCAIRLRSQPAAVTPESPAAG